MCIAIACPAGKVIEDAILKECFKNNKDGCGFAYINEDYTGIRRLKIKKTMDFDIFLRQYHRAVLVNPNSPFLIHFRIATHGTVDKFNCHPFKINDDMVFIHNGIISGVGKCQKKSDTQLFNDIILKELPDDWQYNAAITALIENFIGFSKLVTLDTEGNMIIFNEGKGYWEDGVWYSNLSYKKPKVTYYPAPTPYNFRKDDKGFGRGTYCIFESCSGCGIQFDIDTLRYYVDRSGRPVEYCDACEKEKLQIGSIKKEKRIMKRLGFIQARHKYTQEEWDYEYVGGY